MHSGARDGSGFGGEAVTPAHLVCPEGPAVVRTEVDEVSSALCEHDQPLDLGRSQRLVNRAQRRALRFRDGPGCGFPGCSARHVDAHHITFWADGGPTDLANLILLCRHHHRLLHEGGYTAALIDNRPRFYRPDHTPIRPPEPPPADPARGSAQLRRQHRQHGHTIDHTTPGARSGGSPIWSPQAALDALYS
jgi:HNH endonuclease